MSKSGEASSLEDSCYNIPSTQPEKLRPKVRELAPYCLLCAVFKAFTVVLIAVGIIVLLLWLVLQPDALKVYVEHASLTKFDLDANNTLHYNLRLGISLRNPNKKIGIHYQRIQAMASYNGATLGQQEVPRFHQQRKSTATVDVSFDGVRAVSAGSGVAETYDREKGEGWFYIGVKMYTRVRLKMIGVNSAAYAPDVSCALRIPAPINGTASEGYARTGCDVQSFS